MLKRACTIITAIVVLFSVGFSLAADATPATGLSPGFAEVLGALGAFFSVLLLLSILPEKLVEFGKQFFRVNKKKTIFELFGWTSYDKVLLENRQEKLRVIYKAIYDAVPENVAWSRYPPRQKVADNRTQGLTSPNAITSTSGTSAEDLQYLILRLDMRLKDFEGRRITWLRIWGMLLSVLIAWKLSINALYLLEPIFRNTPPELKKLFMEDWGAIITGLGAGMGAPFWQDVLDRMTKAKEKAGKLK